MYGVNIKSGLKIVANNSQLYVRLLEKYITNAMYPDFLTAVEGGDTEEICQKAHAMKGTSANLGLDDIAQLLKECELAVKNGMQLQSTPVIVKLKEVYDKTVESIKTIIADPELLNEYKITKEQYI
jgi:HPt (histidine-containing phosphotransfer) domain-containing protein